MLEVDGAYQLCPIVVNQRADLPLKILSILFGCACHDNPFIGQQSRADGLVSTLCLVYRAEKCKVMAGRKAWFRPFRQRYAVMYNARFAAKRSRWN